MTRRDFGRRCLVLALLAAMPASTASALGTAFTYQGQLQQNGAPSNGTCDFQFSLWDAIGSGAPPTGGSQIGSTQTKTGVNVNDGVFTLPLDFGASAFSSGSDRWLSIAVRCPAGSGSYQALAPRQPLTATPFALFANNIADGAVSSAKLAPGAVTTSQLGSNAVTAAQIADGTVATNDLANNAVSTANIGDGQVTAAKLFVPLRLTSSVPNSRIGAFDGASTGTNAVGVSGTANNGVNAIGVFGSSTTVGTGVAGESDDGNGVRGTSRDGTGVFGESLTAPGVWGDSQDDGVFGSSSGSGNGVSGMAGAGAGVRGESLEGVGVEGVGKNTGVMGFANLDTNSVGVFGDSPMGAGVYGRSAENQGVVGLGHTGVIGYTGDSNGTGVSGISVKGDDPNATGVYGNANKGIGVRGSTASGWAGYFTGPVFVGNGNLLVAGNLSVSGAITGAVKQFKIDHPLDPANKYLVHAAIESSEMKNFYDGVVVLDSNGEAKVELPEWFETLNRDFRYQLTCIGGVAPVYIADEVSEGHFRIAGGTSGLKVSWLITGVRKDAFAVAHPLVVEAEKTGEERGRYLYPTEMGAPASLSVDHTKSAERR